MPNLTLTEKVSEVVITYYVGLVIFMIVVAVNVIALFIDSWLLYTARPTITEVIQKSPWLTNILLSTIAVGWQIVGAIGLLIHLLSP